MPKIEELSTADLSEKLSRPGSAIVDVRPVAAYNGWVLQGEARGGHISGAKSLPLQWTQYLDWVEVLDEKNIIRDRPVIIYGYDAKESKEMGEQLLDLGFQEVS